MSNRKKELNRFMSAQGTLFDSEITEGALDVSMAFRDSLSKDLRKHKESRWQVAAKMSELCGRNISKDMLDKYTSSNPDYSMRAEDLTAFCAVTKSVAPIKALLEPLGCDVVTPEESEFVRLARLERKRVEIETEIAQIRHRVGIAGS